MQSGFLCLHLYKERPPCCLILHPGAVTDIKWRGPLASTTDTLLLQCLPVAFMVSSSPSTGLWLLQDELLETDERKLEPVPETDGVHQYRIKRRNTLGWHLSCRDGNAVADDSDAALCQRCCRMMLRYLLHKLKQITEFRVFIIL